MLVAEACGQLAPLVAPEMRPSLVLSMLAQLAGDAEPPVRAAAAAALASLLPHLATLDKYGTVCLWSGRLCPLHDCSFSAFQTEQSTRCTIW